MIEILKYITVSILVLMELPLQLVYIAPVHFLTVVSILVLMELPLQPIAHVNKRIVIQGFNPCFNGTTSATKVHF